MAREVLGRRASWPHALLLHGPAGIGKRILANNLARALLCESPTTEGLACGNCPSCHYVSAGQHPDLRRIEPLTVEDDGTIKLLDAIPVAAVRDLIDFVSLTSHRRVAKVAIIAPAEKMNVAAANALLKTLEEPPPDTFLLLVAHQPGRLPATVRSRCRALHASLPTLEEARRWLVGQGIGNPDALLAQAGGAPLTALALADATLQEERTRWMSALARPDTLSPLTLSARIESAGRDERKHRLAAAIDWLSAWTSDLARVTSGGAPLHNPDFAAPLAVLATKVERIPLFRYHRTLLGQRLLLAHPLQPRLVAEALLIDYRALFD